MTRNDACIAEIAERHIAEAIAELLQHRAASARDLAGLQPGEFRDYLCAANERSTEIFEQMVLDSAGDGAGMARH
jgi:hypothetical protein